MKYAYCGKVRVSARELRVGMKVEREHTRRFRSRRRALVVERKTACDHLVEFPFYYTRGLLPMERKLEREAKRHRRGRL